MNFFIRIILNKDSNEFLNSKRFTLVKIIPKKTVHNWDVLGWQTKKKEQIVPNNLKNKCQEIYTAVGC